MTIVDNVQRVVIVTDGQNFGISKCRKDEMFNETFGRKLANARFEEAGTSKIMSEISPLYILDGYIYKPQEASMRITHEKPIKLELGVTYKAKLNGEKIIFTYDGTDELGKAIYDSNVELICDNYRDLTKVKKLKYQIGDSVTIDSNKFKITRLEIDSVWVRDTISDKEIFVATYSTFKKSID